MSTEQVQGSAPAHADVHRVSCVIPTHGRPQYLTASLRSVLEQSRRPDEVVVVSDMSDPAAEALCARFTTDAVPVRYLQSASHERGASSSRNLGARSGVGDVIAFLDDDDLWAPDYLERALGELSEAKSLVVTWLRLFTADSETEGQRIGEGLTAGDVGAANPGVTGSNLVVRRAAFEDIDGFDAALPMKNDTDFLFRFLMAGHDYAVSSGSYVRQRKHGDGQLTDRTSRRVEGLEKYLAKHSRVLTLTQRRRLRLEIHRLQRALATTRRHRVVHVVGTAANYGFAELRSRADHA